MKYEFHREAEAELVDASTYYDRKRPGLGAEFEKVVERGCRTIMAYPTIWPARFEDVADTIFLASHISSYTASSETR